MNQLDASAHLASVNRIEGTEVRSRSSQSLRVLIYSHDTFGLGHYRRCLKIAKQIAAEIPSSSVLIITGSPLVDRYPLPAGVDSVKLPAVVKVGREDYRSRSSRLPFANTLHVRSEIISATAAAFSPDIVLVDHAPLGLQGEAHKMLELCRSMLRKPYLVLGLRDIVDHPEQVVPIWTQTGVYDAMAMIYNRIVIYGTPGIYDPVDAYSFPEVAARKTSFVGYISDPPAKCANCVSRKTGKKSVVVTVGGGEDGQLIVDVYLSMLEQFGPRIEFDTTLLPGPLLSESAFSALCARASSLPVHVEHFVSEITGLLGAADLVVAMGGYNTVAEILSHARRAIIIPREDPRREQLIRAQRLSALNVVQLLRFCDLTASRLHESICQALETPSEDVTEARRCSVVPLDGTHRLVELLTHTIMSPEEARIP